MPQCGQLLAVDWDCVTLRRQLEQAPTIGSIDEE